MTTEELAIKEAVEHLREVREYLEPFTPETESAPDEITLVISEVDRQTADNFCEHGACLIATSLANRGYNVVKVGVQVCWIEVIRLRRVK